MAVFRAFSGMFRHMMAAVVGCFMCGITTSAMAADTYTISYTCGSGSGNAPATYTPTNLPENVHAPENTCTAPSGYYFSHWLCTNVKNNNSYNVYPYFEYGSANYNINISNDTGSVTCVAQWDTPPTCRIDSSQTNELLTYNYGTCSMQFIPGASAYAPDSNDGSTVQLVPTLAQLCAVDPNCGGTLSSCVNNYANFNGWSCDFQNPSCGPDSLGLQNGDLVPSGAWECKLSTCNSTCTAIIQYNVLYDCGTGTGTIASGTATTGQSFTFATNSCTAPNGATFTGWSCSNGVGDKSAGQNVSAWNYNTGTTCTAQWEGGSSSSCDKDCTIVNITDKGSVLYGYADKPGNASGYINGNSEKNNAEQFGLKNNNTWGVKFNSYGTITGTAMCDEQRPSGAVLVTTGKPVGPNGSYCWCNADTYTPLNGSAIQLTTDWVYTYGFNDPNECSQQCAAMCASNFSTEQQMRETVYDTGTYCDCSYKVTYDCNGGTGTAPTDNTQYSSNSSVQTQQNGSNNCRKTNYAFNGWSCGGVNVNAGDSFTITSNTTCSAQWTPTYTVTYSCGDGSGNAPVDSAHYTSGSIVTMLGNTCTAPANSSFIGYKCNGTWRTSSFTITSDTTCVAQWTEESTPETYTVTYTCGAGTGAAPTDNTPHASGTSVTTEQNTCTALDNASFTHWNCNGTNVNAGNTFTITDNTTCVAQWSCNNGYKLIDNPLADFYTYTWNNSADTTDEHSGYSSNVGTIYFKSVLSSELGTRPLNDDPINVYYPDSMPPSGNDYCWCRISGFTPANGTYEAINYLPWVGLNQGPSYGGNCLDQCDDRILGSLSQSLTNFKTTLFSSDICVPDDYTITLDDNGGSGGSGTIYTTYDTNVYNDSARTLAMTTSANPVSVPTYSNRTFQGYFSATTGGTQYIDANGRITSDGLVAGKGYTTNNNTWYAQWTEPALHVYYYCGNAEGTAPTNSNSYSSGAEVATESTPGSCSKPGYAFNGWECSQGLLTEYVSAGDSFIITSNAGCAAQWIQTYTVTYSCGNGSGTAPTNPNHYQSGATVTVAGNNTSSPCTNQNGAFTAWSCNGVFRMPNTTFQVTGNTICIALYSCDTGHHPYNPLAEHASDNWDWGANGMDGDELILSGFGKIDIVGIASCEYGLDSNRNPIRMYYPPNAPTSGNNCSGYGPNDPYGNPYPNGDSTPPYCWCRISGFTPANGTYEAINYLPWVGISQSANGIDCSHYCTEYTNASILLRSVMFSGNACLVNEFTVHYTGNGNTSGSVPSDHTCRYGDTCTAAGHGNLAKTNSVFDNWAITSCQTENNQNCSILVSSPVNENGDLTNATTEDGATITLTAQWSGSRINLKWLSGTDNNIITPEYCIYGSQAEEPNAINNIQQPTRTGYTFKGWKTSDWQSN